MPSLEDLIVIEPRMDEMMEKLAFGKDEKEGQNRCQACYLIRLREFLEYAKEHRYEYVTTVMTMSRQKCSQKINQAAQLLMPLFDHLIYLYSDFKKRNGINRSVELCKAYSIYQQNYCGCKYSIRRGENE